MNTKVEFSEDEHVVYITLPKIIDEKEIEEFFPQIQDIFNKETAGELRVVIDVNGGITMNRNVTEKVLQFFNTHKQKMKILIFICMNPLFHAIMQAQLKKYNIQHAQFVRTRVEAHNLLHT